MGAPPKNIASFCELERWLEEESTKKAEEMFARETKNWRDIKKI